MSNIIDVDEEPSAQEYIPEPVYVAEFEGQEPVLVQGHVFQDERVTDEKARRAYEIQKLGYDPLNIPGAIEGSEGSGFFSEENAVDDFGDPIKIKEELEPVINDDDEIYYQPNPIKKRKNLEDWNEYNPKQAPPPSFYGVYEQKDQKNYDLHKVTQHKPKFTRVSDELPEDQGPQNYINVGQYKPTHVSAENIQRPQYQQQNDTSYRRWGNKPHGGFHKRWVKKGKWVKRSRNWFIESNPNYYSYRSHQNYGKYYK